MSTRMITTKLPTYLEALLQENTSLKLVYKDKNNKVVSISSDEEIQEVNDVSELELTGNPLKTDLGADDTVCSDIILERPCNWTREEAQQYPLTLNEARSLINCELRLRNSMLSIYCICDGSDIQKTVGLGTLLAHNKITRTVVSVLPCCNENSETITIENLKKEHFKNVRKIADFEIVTQHCYNLFGYNLRNCSSLQNLEYNGNVAVEVLNIETSGSFGEPNTKLNLQVVIGHDYSPIHMLWQELCRVQSYINILQTLIQFNDSTVINSVDYMNCDELISIIDDFVPTLDLVQKIKKGTFHVISLGEVKILDNLWNILKYCKTLSDLRECFHFFFEELVEKVPDVQILNEDYSTIGEIVNGILAGRIAVPTLSFSQCLELLVDLGLEKLKNDYLVVINKFSLIAKESFMDMWKELKNNKTVVNTISQRRTRVSVALKTTIADMTNSKMKLMYLYSCHKFADFLFLAKENLHKECIQSLCNTFIGKFDKTVRWMDIKQLRLCEFSYDFHWSSTDAKSHLQNKSPTTFAVKMMSHLDLATVTTVFHFSEFPILPPSIYDNYDISCEKIEDAKPYYVTKCVNYTQIC